MFFMTLLTRKCLALILLGGLASTPAWALFEDAEARRAILELRQSVQDIRQSVQDLRQGIKAQDDDVPMLRRALLDLQGQIEALKSELAKVRGEREVLAREISEWQLRMRDAQSQVEERFRRLEPIKVSVDGLEFMADPIEKREFESAFESMRKGDFAGARQAFTRFLARYPTSGYEPTAQFWLGSALYALREYKDAMSPFRQLLQTNPEHVRAPEAMLSIANVFVELKDTKAARKSMEDLIKAYPQSEAAQTAKARLSKLR